jgi:hypothetical protein
MSALLVLSFSAFAMEGNGDLVGNARKYGTVIEQTLCASCQETHPTVWNFDGQIVRSQNHMCSSAIDMLKTLHNFGCLGKLEKIAHYNPSIASLSPHIKNDSTLKLSGNLEKLKDPVHFGTNPTDGFDAIAKKFDNFLQDNPFKYEVDVRTLTVNVDNLLIKIKPEVEDAEDTEYAENK